MHAAIESLLVLQDRDQRVAQMHGELARVPIEVETYESRITQEEANIEAAKDDLQQLELKRSQLDQGAQAARDRADRYKGQQLQVKKNEEYRALQVEIDNAYKEVSEIEDQELEVMLELDDKRAATASTIADHETAIGQMRQQIKLLHEREESLRGQLVEAEAHVATAREQVEPAALALYDETRQRVSRPPYVVPLVDRTCKGCFLKVSNETENKVRKELAQCENCGRILYMER